MTGAAGYGLCLSAEEMAKIGLLCLQKGVFHNRRIVSEKWIEESTTARLRCSENINPQRELAAAVSAYFKPTVYDRIDFIRGQIEGNLCAEIDLDTAAGHRSCDKIWV